MTMTERPEPIKLVVCIVERGGADTITQICFRYNIAFHMMLRGTGTADSELMDLLGLGENEKDVMILSVKQSESDALLGELSDEMELDKPGKGIAFTIPLASVATARALRVLSGIDREKLKEKIEEHRREEEAKHEG